MEASKQLGMNIYISVSTPPWLSHKLVPLPKSDASGQKRSSQLGQPQPSVTKRTCETECETRSEDPSTLSPASSVRVLPDGLQPQQLGEMLIQLDNADTEERAAEGIMQTNKYTNINPVKDAIEKLEVVGTEYHNILDLIARNIINSITGYEIKDVPLQEGQTYETVKKSMLNDAKVLESCVEETKIGFQRLLASMKSNLFCQPHTEKNELMQETEEKINNLEKENADLQSMVTLIENEAQDYKVKFENEREQVKRLQVEKCSVELEMETKFLTEQQKCEKLEHKIKNMEVDIKCKDEMYEKSRQDYQKKTNVSADRITKLEKEKTELESSKELCTQLEHKIRSMLEDQAQDTTKQQLEMLSKKTQSMESALKKAYECNARKEQELEDAREEVEEMVRLMHGKDCLLKMRNEQIAYLHNKELVQQEEMDRADSELDSYRRHYQKMQVELKEKDGQLEFLKEELQRIESDLVKMKTKNKVLRKRLNDQ